MRAPAALLLLTISATALAQPQPLPTHRPAPTPYTPPPLTELLPPATTDLSSLLRHYTADETTLRRFHSLTVSPATFAAQEQFYSAWRRTLDQIPFEPLSLHGRAEYLTLRLLLDQRLHATAQRRARIAEIAPLLPFAPAIIELREARERVDPLDPRDAATRVTQANKQAREMVQWLSKPKPERPKSTPSEALRAAAATAELQGALKDWYTFYNDYDPLFTWWLAEPYKTFDATLTRYRDLLRENLAGLAKDDTETIIGDPVGRDALTSALRAEMIPYSPEQILAIGQREFAWCEAEMKKASRELGFGDDWKRAVELVKTRHVPPGEQPTLILGLGLEAIDFVSSRNLLTLPANLRDHWRIGMMSPERQRVNPFFTGGSLISVSYPTAAMTHEQKLMSMRGNNIPFARATVFHEVIPGHNLQFFMMDRYRSWRGAFWTPFWMEGWALYWEFLLWDLNFPRNAEDKVGALFWRMHRAARIVFSLSFHLGKMTAQQCVDYLVNEVGHERDNAAAEVRRSFESGDAPLYQAAYMLGGLQFRALHRDLVQSGKLSNREFHDTILRLNVLPVDMIRATLTNAALPKDYTPNWKFYGDINP